MKISFDLGLSIDLILKIKLLFCKIWFLVYSKLLFTNPYENENETSSSKSKSKSVHFTRFPTQTQSQSQNSSSSLSPSDYSILAKIIVFGYKDKIAKRLSSSTTSSSQPSNHQKRRRKFEFER